MIFAYKQSISYLSMNFFLATYTIRVFKKVGKESTQKTKESRPLNIDNFDKDKSDLFDIARKFLLTLRKQPINNIEKKKVLKLIKYKSNREKRIITGVFESGYYGLAGNLIDVENYSSRKKKSTEADAKPYFFLIYLPQNRDEGILVLEMIGNHGIKKIITNHFCKEFKESYPGYYSEISSLIPEEIIRQIINDGIVKKLRFVRFRKPSDRADTLKNIHFEEPVQVELVVSGKNLNVKEKLLSVFNKGSQVHNLIELADSDFDYDTIKTEIHTGNDRRKTLDLSDFINAKNSIDITDKIKLVSGGHPEFSTIENVAISHLYKTIEMIDDDKKINIYFLDYKYVFKSKYY